MADECAGKDKNILECVEDGGEVGLSVIRVGKEVADVVSVCKKGINANIAAAGRNGDLCDLCKDVMKKGIDAGASLCKRAPGSLDGLCEQACDYAQTECDGTLDCPA